MKEYIQKDEVINLLHSSLDRDTVTEYIHEFKGFWMDDEDGEECQLEELKEIAGKLGYSLVKKQPKIKLLSCKCGRKRINKWTHVEPGFGVGYVYRCTCGMRAEPGKTKREARENWNKMILGETEEC